MRPWNKEKEMVSFSDVVMAATPGGVLEKHQTVSRKVTEAGGC